MTQPKPRLKCTEKEFCHLFDARVNGQEGRRIKGFVIGTLIQFATGKLFTSPVFYQDAGSEPPVYVNYCPFCGKDFRPRLKRFEDAKKKAAEEHAKSGKPPFIAPKPKKTAPKVKRRAA